MSNRLLGYRVNKFYGRTFGEVDITEQLEQDLYNELMVEDELLFLVPNPKFRKEYYILYQLLTSRKRASRRIEVRPQAITDPERKETFKSYKFDRAVIANINGVLFFDRSNMTTIKTIIDTLIDKYENDNSVKLRTINETDYWY